MRMPKPFAAVLVAALFAVPVAHAQSLGVETGRPLPRFESLRYDEVNLRRGASEKHPIAVVYNRKGLPVEVLREYRDWRRVRDHEGTTGWIKRTQLSTTRMAMILGEVAPLHRRDAPDARVIARLSPGMVLELGDCDSAWCAVRVSGYRGYVPRRALWGVRQIADPAEEGEGGAEAALSVTGAAE